MGSEERTVGGFRTGDRFTADGGRLSGTVVGLNRTTVRIRLDGSKDTVNCYPMLLAKAPACDE